jgi:hypothetical protein
MERMVSSDAREGNMWQSPRPSSARRTAVQAGTRMKMSFQKTSVAELSDEDRLNDILDRINDNGYDSLSEDDRRFLEEYSSR